MIEIESSNNEEKVLIDLALRERVMNDISSMMNTNEELSHTVKLFCDIELSHSTLSNESIDIIVKNLKLLQQKIKVLTLDEINKKIDYFNRMKKYNE